MKKKELRLFPKLSDHPTTTNWYRSSPGSQKCPFLCTDTGRREKERLEIFLSQPQATPSLYLSLTPSLYIQPTFPRSQKRRALHPFSMKISPLIEPTLSGRHAKRKRPAHPPAPLLLHRENVPANIAKIASSHSLSMHTSRMLIHTPIRSLVVHLQRTDRVSQLC